jgi:hypothetical protein
MRREGDGRVPFRHGAAQRAWQSTSDASCKARLAIARVERPDQFRIGGVLGKPVGDLLRLGGEVTRRRGGGARASQSYGPCGWSGVEGLFFIWLC